MASEVVSLSFANRQVGIITCRVVNLLFLEGEVRAEYIVASEYKSSCGLWYYSFLVQEEDLVGGIVFDDIKSCNLLDPYWECFTPSESPVCDYAELLCFSGIDQLEELGDDDTLAFVVSDPDCEWDCLAIGDPTLVSDDGDFTPGSTPTPSPPPTPTPTPDPDPTPTPSESVPPATPSPSASEIPPPTPSVPVTPEATPSPSLSEVGLTPEPTPTVPDPTPSMPATPEATPTSTFFMPTPSLPETPPVTISESADSTPSIPATPDTTPSATL